MKYKTKNKFLLLAFFSLTFFFIFTYEAKAVAPWLIYLGISAGIPLLLGTLKAIISVTAFITIIGGVHFLAGQLITAGINFQTALLDPEKITVIQSVWTILRDFVNIFFILILLVIAFATIFNIKNYKASDLLPNLIIAALLINFGLVITVWVIDLLWVPASVFLRPLGPDIGGQIANVLNIQKFFDPGFIAGIFSGGVSETVEWIFRGVLFMVEAFIFAWIALIIWARIPVLIGLMIISPIAWLGYTLPAIRKQSWDAWWSKLFCWGAIPIPLLGLIYFVTLFNQRLNAEIGRAVPASVLNSALSFIGFNTSQAIVWIMTVGLFLGGLMYVKGLSCSMYGLVTLGFGKTWGGIRRGVGGAVDLSYQAFGVKGAVGRVQERMSKEGYPLPFFGRRLGTTAREAREARVEDYLAKGLGLPTTLASQRNLLDNEEKARRDIDNRFKQARTVDETNQIIAELRTKIEGGAKDPETLAAINTLAKKGELDVGLFNKAVDNFKDMPLALSKVISEWKEGKFGGLAKAEDLLTILKDNRLGREAKALGYAFVASKDGSKVAEKITLDDYSKGYQILGRNTKERREFKKNIGKLKPPMVAEYNWTHRTEEFEPDKMPIDMADTVLKQIEGASAKDFAEYDKNAWDDRNFRAGLTKLLIEKRKQIPGSERKFKQELAKRFIREGKGKQLKALNEISPVSMREVAMGEPPEETEGEGTTL